MADKEEMPNSWPSPFDSENYTDASRDLLERAKPGPPLALQMPNDNGGNLPSKLTVPIANQLIAAFGTQEPGEIRRTVSIGCIGVYDQDPKTSLSWHVALRLPRELMFLYDEHNGVHIRSGRLFNLGYQLFNGQSIGMRPDCATNGLYNTAADAEYNISGIVDVTLDSSTGVFRVSGDLVVRGRGKPIHLMPSDRIENPSLASEPPRFGEFVVNESNFVDSFIECWSKQLGPTLSSSNPPLQDGSGLPARQEHADK